MNASGKRWYGGSYIVANARLCMFQWRCGPCPFLAYAQPFALWFHLLPPHTIRLGYGSFAWFLTLSVYLSVYFGSKVSVRRSSLLKSGRSRALSSIITEWIRKQLLEIDSTRSTIVKAGVAHVKYNTSVLKKICGESNILNINIYDGRGG